MSEIRFTKVEKFEDAIREFGIDATLEYFSIPEYGREFFKKELALAEASHSSDSGGQKDWEIVKGRNENGELHDWVIGNHGWASCHDKGCQIHSVKRLRDGKVFSVGDRVAVVSNTHYTIQSFKINSQNIMEVHAGVAFPLWFDAMSKLPPERSKLFTTEDGVDVFKMDIVWQVTTLEGCWKVYSTTAGEKIIPTPIYFKYFSTRDKAIEYVTLNKPCLSVNDVMGISLRVPYTCRNSYSFQRDELKELAKTKIKI